MAQVSNEFVVPCSRDRAVLAVQDVLDQFGWPIAELSSTLIVSRARDIPLADWLLAKVVFMFADGDSADQTRISISVTYPGPLIGSKKQFAGILGRVTNSVSLRAQTESLAINPTVAVGQGQGTESASQSAAAGPSRAQQLKDLKELWDAGVLTDEEFNAEKSRVLNAE